MRGLPRVRPERVADNPHTPIALRNSFETRLRRRSPPLAARQRCGPTHFDAGRSSSVRHWLKQSSTVSAIDPCPQSLLEFDGPHGQREDGDRFQRIAGVSDVVCDCCTGVCVDGFLGCGGYRFVAGVRQLDDGGVICGGDRHYRVVQDGFSRRSSPLRAGKRRRTNR
jgi:hypothetical protein